MQFERKEFVNFAAQLPNGIAPNSRTELRQTPEWNCAKLPIMGYKLLYGRKLQT